MDKIFSSTATLLLLMLAFGPASAETVSSTVTKNVEPPKPLDSLDQLLAGKDMTGTPPKPPRVEVLGPQTSTTGEDRSAPNYDSRDERPASAGEVLIWIPRVIFFPVHLVFEYLLRWPLVNGLARAEEVKLFQRITDWFTWRDGKSGIFPTFFADFGLKPSIGLSTFHREVPSKSNDISAALGWWYPNWWNAKILNRTSVLEDESGKIDLFGSFVSRPDSPFWGIGANTNGEVNPPFRYERRQAEGGLAFLAALGGLSRFKVSAAYRFTDFEDDPDVDDLEDRDEDDALPLIPVVPPDIGCAGAALPIDAPGFLDPNHPDCLARHHFIDTRMEVKLDTRHPDTEFRGGSGFLLEVFGGFTFSPAETALNFVRYGGEIAGFYDITDIGHVIALRLRTELIWRTGTDLRAGGRSEIPFTELASLGGLDTMRGYLPGRFLGDSTLEATLSYRYPVWSLIDAELFFGLGNAYEGHYGIGDPGENFRFDRLFFDAGLGIRTSLKRDTGLQILIAFGTNRLDGGDGDGGQGLELDSVRFVFGLAEGF